MNAEQERLNTHLINERVWRVNHADELTRQATLIHKARIALENAYNPKWKCVRSIFLEIDKVYIIRRTYSKTSHESPIVAKWTTSGWQAITGQLSITISCQAGIEIFS